MGYERKAPHDFSWADFRWEDVPPLIIGVILFLTMSFSALGSLFL